mgnify:CR=1 FL=1
MLKCPYCFELLEVRPQKCPHCQQFLLDDPVEVDYKSIDKKNCIFCGKKILSEAKFCKYCRKWLDQVDIDANTLDMMD